MSHYVSHCLGVSTYRVKSREQVRIDLENNFIIATKVAVLTKRTEINKNQEYSSSKVISTMAVKPIKSTCLYST